MSVEQQNLKAGTQFERYEVVRLVGSGAMGAVYEALHVDLKKRVALKVLQPALARQPKLRARFLREGEAASRIKHPNVVDVTDTGVHDGMPFIVMEYLEGEDLGAVLRREKWLPLSRLVDILLPICAAVEAVHESGIVHRDVKPSNILLARSRLKATQPKLLDFGISHLDDATEAGGRVAGEGGSADSGLLGTPYYMSPEQVANAGTVDARADQYALGVILYEGSTGVRPFDGHSVPDLLRDITQRTVVTLRSHLPELPQAFEAVVMRAMARNPSDRFSSVHALAQALLPFASTAGQAVWGDVFGAEDDVRSSIAGVNGVGAAAMAQAYRDDQSRGSLTAGLQTHPGGTSAPFPLAASHPGSNPGLSTLTGVPSEPPAQRASAEVPSAVVSRQAPVAPLSPPVVAAASPAAASAPRRSPAQPGELTPARAVPASAPSRSLDEDLDPPLVPVHSARPAVIAASAVLLLVILVAVGMSWGRHAAVPASRGSAPPTATQPPRTTPEPAVATPAPMAPRPTLPQIPVAVGQGTPTVPAGPSVPAATPAVPPNGIPSVPFVPPSVAPLPAPAATAGVVRTHPAARHPVVTEPDPAPRRPHVARPSRSSGHTPNGALILE